MDTVIDTTTSGGRMELAARAGVRQATTSDLDSGKATAHDRAVFKLLTVAQNLTSLDATTGIEEILTWLSEDDAMLRSGRGEAWFHSPFAEAA